MFEAQDDVDTGNPDRGDPMSAQATQRVPRRFRALARNRVTLGSRWNWNQEPQRGGPNVLRCNFAWVEPPRWGSWIWKCNPGFRSLWRPSPWADIGPPRWGYQAVTAVSPCQKLIDRWIRHIQLFYKQQASDLSYVTLAYFTNWQELQSLFS